MTTRDKFLAVRDELNAVLLERSSAIDNALLAVISGEHFLQLGPPGCLSGETELIYRRGKRHGGRKITMKQLWHKFNRHDGPRGKQWGRTWDENGATLLHSYDHGTGKVFYNRVLSVLSSGQKPCRTLSLSSGESLTLTQDHPVLTPDGFVHAGALALGNSVVCRGSMLTTSTEQKAPRKERMVVEGLKHYRSGWDHSTTDQKTGKTYHYKRQHRARLVLEAQINGLSYAAYIAALKTDATAMTLQCLPEDSDVHHKNENPLDDRPENLEVLSKSQHTLAHDPLSRFNVEYTRIAYVVGVQDAGEQDTYDIQMAAPANNFATAGGVFVHNTGKSLLVRAVTLRIEGAQYYERLMSSFTVPEELFGPIDLVGYAERGEYRRISSGSLSCAHVGFLDEIYKSNSAILNSLLTILNERLLHEVGQSPQRVPLLSLFAASNETPQDDSLRALDDRFLLREVVLPVQEESSFVALIGGRLDYANVTASVTLDDIRAAQGEVASVKGTSEVLQALLTLKSQLSAEGVVVSDRRWRQIGKLLKAKAWMEGNVEIEVEDLTCLMHACWTDPKEAKPVQRIIYEIACPLYLRALEMEDQAQEVYSKLPKVASQDYNAMAENCLVQLTDMHHALKGDIANSTTRKSTRALQSLGKIASLHKSVSTSLFKNVSRMTLAV